jgi:hypothetical protein
LTKGILNYFIIYNYLSYKQYIHILHFAQYADPILVIYELVNHSTQRFKNIICSRLLNEKKIGPLVEP